MLVAETYSNLSRRDMHVVIALQYCGIDRSRMSQLNDVERDQLAEQVDNNRVQGDRSREIMEILTNSLARHAAT